MRIHGRMLQPPCLRSAGTVVSRGSPGKWPRPELWRRWQMAEAGCELDPGGAAAGSSTVLPSSPSIELVLDVPREGATSGVECHPEALTDLIVGATSTSSSWELPGGCHRAGARRSQGARRCRAERPGG